MIAKLSTLNLCTHVKLLGIAKNIAPLTILLNVFCDIKHHYYHGALPHTAEKRAIS